MNIASSTTTQYTYEPVTYTPASYTSANALPSGSNAPAPNPADTSATSTSALIEQPRKVDVKRYKVENEMCWSFELKGETITSWAIDWVDKVTQSGRPIKFYEKHNVYFIKQVITP